MIFIIKLGVFVYEDRNAYQGKIKKDEY